MIKKYLALLLAVLLLTSCSSKFAYNNLDWLLYWYIDDYIELERPQKKQFDLRLDSWLAWHRGQELIKYRDQIEHLRQQLSSKNLTAPEWQQIFDNAQQHWVRLRNRVTPELVAFSRLLSDQQIQSLFDELQENQNDQIEEQAELSVEEQLKERRKGLQKFLKGWIGRLSESQKQIISESVPKFHRSFQLRVDYQKQVRQDTHALLKQRHSNPNFQTDILLLLNQPEDYQSQEYKDLSHFNEQVFANMTAAINITLNEKQKRHLDKRLAKLIKTIDGLVE